MSKINSRAAIVFESPTKRDARKISALMRKGLPVWIIEPFHAYHHKKGLRFFPPLLPPDIEALMRQGKLPVIRADELQARSFYMEAADKAVGTVEAVYPSHRKKHEKLIRFACDTLESPVAENVFKMNLCNTLAEFFSVNILLERVHRKLGGIPFVITPDANILAYRATKKLLFESGQTFFDYPEIRFSRRAFWDSAVSGLKQSAKALTMLAAQTAASGLLGGKKKPGNGTKKNFIYGVTVLGGRQMRDHQRGPGFIIDEKKIPESSVVIFPLTTLTKDPQKVISLSKDQQRKLRELSTEVFSLPQIGRYFSDFPAWRRMFGIAMRKYFLRNGEELMSASNLFVNYFIWKSVREQVDLKHFISHGDFGKGHVGRNIALNQVGVQTWYFNDSMNLGLNYRNKNDGHHARHPFWAYLLYDHLVTWDRSLAEYYQGHPETFKQVHIVGCLWGEHIREKEEARRRSKLKFIEKMRGYFTLSAFDSTFSRNGVTSYQEGIAFAADLLRLVEEFPDIYVILKEKKNRAMHRTLDPILGPELLDLYNQMDAHPRITICSDQTDASELISISDLVVSFPFTSTTFEALSAGRAAIWHDAGGHYRSTIYGETGVVTHDYEELKAKLRDIRALRPGDFRNPFPMDSPIMDPFRDGKAIDRFRDLLTTS